MKVLLLGGHGEYTDIVYNEISKYYNIVAIIVEDPVPKRQLVKRRMKTLGLRKVMGQILFQMMVVPLLRMKAADRIREIKRLNRMDDNTDYHKQSNCHHIDSVNSEEALQLIRKYSPDVVIVNGTRIISSKILKASDAIFINMHMGITPKYRGVHGGYWALYENDAQNAGVTVHLIDEGIDTGGVLYQGKINYDERDNFCTYPYLQLAEGIKLEKKVLDDIKNDVLKEVEVDLPSMLWSHPTIMEYLHAKRILHVK